MKAIDALLVLLNRVGACRGKAVFVNDEELLQWPKAAVKAMKSQKLIINAKPASSALCTGCERDCVMPVHSLPTTTGKTSSFIVCDKRSDINRVPIPIERLTQWRCNADLVCRFISTSLALRQSVKKSDDVRWEIGMVSGDKRSQMLCLESSDTLTLIAGGSKVSLAEVIEFNDSAYVLDDAQIRRLVDSATTADVRYTPSIARREARKLATQAMYEIWQKEYRVLRKKRPGMSDVWYSQQIAKMEIAQGRDPETIRKQMKK
jgi:hypothetical protein